MTGAASPWACEGAPSNLAPGSARGKPHGLSPPCGREGGRSKERVIAAAFAAAPTNRTTLDSPGKAGGQIVGRAFARPSTVSRQPIHNRR